jgi:hypothetical protein
VLKVDRNFIIALVGGLAQAARARRDPQEVLFSKISTPPSEPTTKNKSTSDNTRLFSFGCVLVPAADLTSTQRQWHFLGGIDANIQDSTRCSDLPTDEQRLFPPEPTCELQVLALSKMRRSEEEPSICSNVAR